ncbi:uncharacterized protein TM35_000521310 [Trypanosoma theileri]|uniref:Surface protease GP63 n=1 Tax=Trypanosoma theileri TaxID=67003 RepID=A0A1X0NH69_9TRYP|nr:uncharacterized protein TM35_000521310 [Trypanosoma theileri]ORC83987.1 hypothetical protein TM35_000521310 [Trypanosoma theileri]
MMKMNRVICVLAVVLCLACGYAMASGAGEVKRSAVQARDEAAGEVEGGGMTGTPTDPEQVLPPPGETLPEDEEDDDEEELPAPDDGTGKDPEEEGGEDTEVPGKPDAPENPENGNPQPPAGDDQETPDQKPEGDKPSTQEPTSTNAPSNEQKPGDADSSFSPVWMRTAAPLLIVAALVL